MRPSLEHQRQALEAEYVERLDAALRRCAAGRCGLFGHNDRAIETLGKYGRQQLIDPEVVELLELGDAIAVARERVGLSDAFEPHHRLIELRSGKSANTRGEPKLAQRWLDELEVAGE